MSEESTTEELRIDSSPGIIYDFANLLGQPRVYLSVLVAGLAALTLPVLGSTYVLNVFIIIFITGSAAVAWNIIGGFGGYFALGNNLFFGIVGYSVGILMVKYGQGFFPALAVGLLLSLVVAMVIGYPAFRLGGHYFALATLAVVEGAWYLAMYAQDLTGGAAGLALYKAQDSFVVGLETSTYFYIGFGVFALTLVGTAIIRYSKLGYYLLAINEDQEAAEALGIDSARYKMYGWLLTAFFTALAGVVNAIYFQYLHPDTVFSLTQSVLYAVLVILGGVGTVVGPVLGTLVLVPVQQVAQNVGGEVGALTYVFYGLLLMLMMVFAPGGLTSRFASVGSRLESAFPSFSVGDGEYEPPWE